MNALMTVDAPELEGVEKSKALQIRNTFQPMAEMLAAFESDYSAVIADSEHGIDEPLIKRAKRLRLDIAKVRIATEKTRKQQKEEYLRAGKAIDGVANILKWAIGDRELKLKEIEDHFEIQERARLERLQRERAKILSQYVDDADQRDLVKFADDEFEALVAMKRQQHEDAIAAAAKAEAERIAREKAEAEERERIRRENERLKAEAAKREAEERARRAKEEAERKAREEQERKKQEALEAKLRAEREERERIEREEREKRERLEAELRAKEEAERKRLAEEAEAKRLAEKEAEEARQAELRKGDDEKFADLARYLKGLSGRYTFRSKAGRAKIARAQDVINQAIAILEG